MSILALFIEFLNFQGINPTELKMKSVTKLTKENKIYFNKDRIIGSSISFLILWAIQNENRWKVDKFLYDGSKIAMDSSSVLSTPFTHTSPWKVWVRAEISIFLFHQYIFYPRGKDTFNWPHILDTWYLIELLYNCTISWGERMVNKSGDSTNSRSLSA